MQDTVYPANSEWITATRSVFRQPATGAAESDSTRFRDDRRGRADSVPELRKDSSAGIGAKRGGLASPASVWRSVRGYCEPVRARSYSPISRLHTPSRDPGCPRKPEWRNDPFWGLLRGSVLRDIAPRS